MMEHSCPFKADTLIYHIEGQNILKKPVRLRILKALHFEFLFYTETFESQTDITIIRTKLYFIPPNIL